MLDVNFIADPERPGDGATPGETQAFGHLQ
jgi:hypothetical protein